MLGTEVRGLGLVVAEIPYDVILGGKMLVGKPFQIDLRSFSLKRACMPSAKISAQVTLASTNNTVQN